MADSDNSMSPPTVTRRELLAGTMITPLPWPATAASPNNTHRDVAIALWRAWKEAHDRTNALCLRQQRLETKLVKSVGFPRATVRLPNGEERIVVWKEQLDELPEDDEASAAIKTEAEAEFATRQAQWDEADAGLGYSAAKHAEEEATKHEQKLAKTLYATRASSLAGIAAKLDVILQQGQSSKDCSEFPWPQIRAVLKDVKEIGGIKRIA